MRRRSKKGVSGSLGMPKAVEEYVGKVTASLGIIPMSEPLKTFVSNVGAIEEVRSLVVSKVGEGKKEANRRMRDYEAKQREGVGFLKDAKESVELLESMRGWVEEEKTEAIRRIDDETLKECEARVGRVVELSEKYQAAVPRLKRAIAEFGELQDLASLRIEGYRKQAEILMPMIFVYLVSIWDAFILDSVRSILRIHPQMMMARNGKTQLSQAAIWGAGSVEDIRNELIKEVVWDLDHDRKKLAGCFVKDWGIDWRKSGIVVDDVVEIRARRDIWVHNKGVVNRQYLGMVGKKSSLREDEVAEISEEYLDGCVDKLTRLSIYVHRVAHEKHYSKADAG